MSAFLKPSCIPAPACRKPRPGRLTASLCILLAGALASTGCTSRQNREAVDRRTAAILSQKQIQALGEAGEFTILPPEETLRHRLLAEQNLAYYSPASLGSAFLEPPKGTPEATPPRTAESLKPADASALPDPFTISLNDALQIAAANSRAYQTRKETVFRTALRLDLEREEFRVSFSGLVSTLFRHDRSDLGTPGGVVTEEQETSALAQASQTLQTGAQLTLRLGLDLLKLLRPGDFSTQSVFGDATINIPLLRGAGRRIAAESLTQAEREALYAIYDFEEFKRGFAVGIARQYLTVLQNEDRVRNAEENYRSLITSSRRARRLLQAGSLPPIQVDQAQQDELRARNRWISAHTTLQISRDNLKLQIGLPIDAIVELNRADFDTLTPAVAGSPDLPAATPDTPETIPPADAPIDLAETSPSPPGPLEIPYGAAIDLAFKNRLDLRIAEARVEDAQRLIVVGADRFKPGLNLRLTGSTSGEKPGDLDAGHGNYAAALLLDLPLSRTPEGIAYRQSLIALEAAVRAVQELEDNIKLAVRTRLRTLHEARESLHIQTLSLQLARRRVRGADLNLQAGRIPIRDLLDAQEDLLSAQNALTAAAINYRLAELDLQRDLGVLAVGPDGLWNEFTPPPSS